MYFNLVFTIIKYLLRLNNMNQIINKLILLYTDFLFKFHTASYYNVFMVNTPYSQ